MKKIVLLILICLVSVCSLQAQTSMSTYPVYNSSNAPVHEVRAVWLTTIGGIDWPRSYARSKWAVKNQQEEFRHILNRLAEAGINTVLLQTRVRGTSIYPSSEPWDACLTGRAGTSPGYDPLAFAIEECHKRGMKLHAWVVSIPIGKWNGAGCKALRDSHPSLVKHIGDEGFMDPEKIGTADYLANLCKDITTRYDIDGIHLDYIRYPDSWGRIYDKNAGRENITRIVKAISKEVKSVKPWVIMSCSPVGKYSDTARQWSHGWNARDIVCQDAALWLREGYMDALFPMMYFRGKDFFPFLVDWKERSEGRIVSPGLGIYFMSPREKNWPLEDITREMNVARQMDMGFCMFRSKFFTDNTKGIYEYTHDIFANAPALQPALTWLSDQRPATPSFLKLTSHDEFDVLSWGATPYYSEGQRLTYNIYGSETFPVDIEKSGNLLMADFDGSSIEVPCAKSIKYYAVTATDRYGNESFPCQINSGGFTSERFVDSPLSVPLLSDGNSVDLSLCNGIRTGEVVSIHSMIGNALTSRVITKDARGNNSIDVSALPTGHYFVYLVNKKAEHLLGRFSIKRF